jgi:hypothetical protein
MVHGWSRLSWCLLFLLLPALLCAQTTPIRGNIVQDGHNNYCEDANGDANANTYICSFLVPLANYHTGAHYSVKASTANTGAVQVNLQAKGLITLKKTQSSVTTDLAPGDICPGQIIDMIYDGVNMQMLSQVCHPDSQTFTILVGSDDPAGSVLTNAALGPQLNLYTFPRAATIQQISVYADAGTPSVIVHRRTGTTNTPLLNPALATAAAGGLACARTQAIAGLEGTTCSATLLNASVPAGHTIGLTSGTAGGTARRMSILVIYTLN